MSERLGFPNVFYDAIVFITPVIILSFGIGLGIAGLGLFSSVTVQEVGTLDFLLLILLVVILGYEIGRMLETISAPLVQTPLKVINRLILRNDNFTQSPKDVYAILGLTNSPDGRKGDKWVLYFFAYVVNPALGGDLLKRYAWEKLARSAACCYVLLTAASGTVLALRQFGIDASGVKGFGTIWYTAAAGVMLLASTFEYYKRNIWNFDLLNKVAPVLIEARRINEERYASFVLHARQDSSTE